MSSLNEVFYCVLIMQRKGRKKDTREKHLCFVAHVKIVETRVSFLV